jgi:hypothetical protein
MMEERKEGKHLCFQIVFENAENWKKIPFQPMITQRQITIKSVFEKDPFP